MPKLTKDNDPPLECILCPNSKHFSDLSHLLTHLNSKGHLQSKHKLELKQSNDEVAKNSLESYDRWYKINNFGELLADRLQPKAKRKYIKQEKDVKVKTRKSSKVIKPESDSDEEFHMARVNSYHAPQPQMNPLFKRSQSFNDAWSAALYETPKSTPVAFTSSARQDTVIVTPVDPALSDGSWRTLLASQDSGNKSKEAALILKGEVFEGMDVFDSATPRTKRRRNQRKEPQVMQRMMRYSEEVEPEETSYLASGELRGTRNVYDPPSDASSPLRKTTPSPPRKRRSSCRAGQENSRNKLVKFPRLSPPNTKLSPLREDPKKCLAPDESKHAPPLLFGFSGNVGASFSQRTVNPFSLLLHPGSQTMIPFDVLQQHTLMGPPSSKNPLADYLTEPFLQSIPAYTGVPDLDILQQQHSRIKLEATTSLKNPLAAYAEHGAVLNQAYLMATPTSGSSIDHTTSHESNDAPTHQGTQGLTLDQDNGSHDNAGTLQPKGPRAGFFKTTANWSIVPKDQADDSSMNLPASNSGAMGTVASVSGATPTRGRPTAKTSALKRTSPRKNDVRTPERQQISSNETKNTRSSTRRLRNRLMVTDHIDDEVFATPRYNLRQAPSSALRSTVHSAKSGNQLPVSETRLHFGSDLDSELFDVVGESFKL